MPHYHFDTHRRALGWLGSFFFLLLIGGVIAGGIGTMHAYRRAVRRHNLKLATEAVDKMTVPADYVQFTYGCGDYRCYRVNRNIRSVAKDAHAVLVSTGARLGRLDVLIPDPVEGCDGAVRTTALGCADDGEVHGQPVTVYLRPVIPPRLTRRRAFPRTEVDVEFSPSLAS